jgi:putative endonuclease
MRYPLPLSWPAVAGHDGFLQLQTITILPHCPYTSTPNLSWPATAGHPGWIMMVKQYYVYILASKRNGTLYIGVTNNLARRVWEHREGLLDGFTQKYGVKRLVHYETFLNVRAAIHREDRLKKWKREWKINLIQKANVEWNDLYEKLVQ